MYRSMLYYQDVETRKSRRSSGGRASDYESGDRFKSRVGLCRASMPRIKLRVPLVLLGDKVGREWDKTSPRAVEREYVHIPMRRPRCVHSAHPQAIALTFIKTQNFIFLALLLGLNFATALVNRERCIQLVRLM